MQGDGIRHRDRAERSLHAGEAASLRDIDVGEDAVHHVAGAVRTIEEFCGDAVQAFAQETGTGAGGITPGSCHRRAEGPVIQGGRLAIEAQGTGLHHAEIATESHRSGGTLQKAAGAGSEIGGEGISDGNLAQHTGTAVVDVGLHRRHRGRTGPTAD